MPFSVHKDLLVEHSAYFQEKFQVKQERGVELRLDLPEEDEETFETLVSWLYWEDFDFPEQKEWKKNSACLLPPMQLYVVAEKFEVTALRKELIDFFFAVAKIDVESIEKELVEVGFGQTKAKSGMKRLLVSWWASYTLEEHSWRDEDSMHQWFSSIPKFAIALAAKLSCCNEDGRESLFESSSDGYF